jgi:hypothetical protein
MTRNDATIDGDGEQAATWERRTPHAETVLLQPVGSFSVPVESLVFLVGRGPVVAP